MVHKRVMYFSMSCDGNISKNKKVKQKLVDILQV